MAFVGGLLFNFCEPQIRLETTNVPSHHLATHRILHHTRKPLHPPAIDEDHHKQALRRSTHLFSGLFPAFPQPIAPGQPPLLRRRCRALPYIASFETATYRLLDLSDT